jgi:hypothetical protein
MALSGDSGDQTTTTLAVFLKSLPSHLRKVIQCLTISPKGTGTEPKIPQDIINFCHEQPKSSLRFYHPLITSSDATRLLFTAFMVKHEARKDTTFVHKMSHQADMQGRLLQSLEKKLLGDPFAPIPPNIIFYPCDREFDEQAFRKASRKCKILRLVVVPTLANGFDDLVAVAKDLYENGF